MIKIGWMKDSVWNTSDGRCTGWPASPGSFSSLKTRNGPRFGPRYSVGMGSLWEVRGIAHFDTGPSGDLNFDPFSWFEPPFLGGQQTSKCEHSRQPYKSRSASLPKSACCLIHLVSRICFSLREKCTSQKYIYFSKFWVLSILHCFLPSAARSLKRTKKHTGIEIRFWGPLCPFEVEGGRNLGSGYVLQNSRFCHVLSVSVVPSVSVESVVESVTM